MKMMRGAVGSEILEGCRPEILGEELGNIENDGGQKWKRRLRPGLTVEERKAGDGTTLHGAEEHTRVPDVTGHFGAEEHWDSHDESCRQGRAEQWL